MKKMSTAARAFLISLALLLLCSVLNWGAVSGWGNVRITRITQVGDNGLRYSALLYVPKSATNETPAPAVLMIHGNSGNARNHESWAVEFTRRGYVVLSVDNLGAGDAEYSNEVGNRAVPLTFAQYLFSQPFVDKERVVASGHSAGCTGAVAIANKYPLAACTLANGRAQEYFKADRPYLGNLLWLTSNDDKMNKEAVVLEQVTLVFTNIGALAAGETLEMNKLYGSFEAGNAVQLVNVPDQIHEGAFVNKGHIGAMLNFVQQAVETPNPIAADDQVWLWKDVFGLCGMLAFAATLLTLAVLMLKIPFFASICQPLPRNIGMRGTPLAISIVVALVFPVVCLYTGSFGLGEVFGSREPNLAIFQVRFTNIALPLVMTLNLFGLVMFFLFHFTWGKKEFNATLRDYGLTSAQKTGLDFALIGKSALLAVLVAAIGWTYLDVQNKVFGTDFYCLFFGYKPLAVYKLVYYIPYIILWVLSFVIASLGMNVERRLPSTGSECKDTLIAVLFNALLATATITAMVLIENLIQHNLGANAVALASWKTDLTRLWGMPVGMFIGGAGNTYLYRKSGSVWPGAILMGIVCALSACLYGQVQF
ncbi:MAG: hypothetical protein IJ347_09710 [Faecalibacterium sp.]|nr:hypothetical protein [Faecalibacterium sp.]